MITSIKSKDCRFYFDANLADPLALKIRELRSELEYDKDVFAGKTALKYIERISEGIDGNVYLLTVSQDISPSNKVRSKKGVLWQEKELRRLDNRSLEIGFSDGKSRLVSLVNLDGFNYDVSEALVLNWVFSLIILSTVSIDTLSKHIEGWLAKGDNSVLPYDYEVIAKDLASLDSTVVLRYFPADNGRPEMLVVVGDREFIEGNIEGPIDSII